MPHREACPRPGATRRIVASALVAGLAVTACAASPSGGADRGAGGDTARSAPDKGTDAGRQAAREARRAEVRFPSGRLFLAEIADTPARLASGYMFRGVIGDSDAMIFVFQDADVHPFWMKNTLVALDMIWMDDAFTVLYIEPSAPPCRADPCPSYGPPRRARYVLEVRGGIAAAERLKTGDTLRVAFPQAAD